MKKCKLHATSLYLTGVQDNDSVSVFIRDAVREKIKALELAEENKRAEAAAKRAEEKQAAEYLYPTPGRVRR